MTFHALARILQTMDDETEADVTGLQETALREPPVLATAPAALPTERYLPLELLGEGGMGEVRLYEDKRVGRRIAMKTMRAEHASSSRLRARFVREARIQGQLEHPAAVPIYDLTQRWQLDQLLPPRARPRDGAL